MKKKMILEKIGIVLLFIVLIVMVFVVPNMNTDLMLGKLYINEVMLINDNTIMDKYGKYSDYIELYNGYDYDVNLYGYYLTDSMKDTRKWTFPDVTIKSGEYLLIFASGKDEVIEDEIHTNFKLDSKGETIALSNSSAKVISKVYVKESLKDTSFGYNGEEYVYYYNGSPGSENIGDYTHDAIYEVNNNYKLEITEYMTNNINYLKCKDNKAYSLIELYNYGDEDINLEDFYLTDKLDNVTKYKFPSVEIKSREYIIIYASGKDEVIEDEIHTNFKLDNEDNVLVLRAPNKSIIDRVEINKLDENKSYGLYDDKWYLYNKPTIGKENTAEYVNGEFINNILINEVSVYPNEAIELKNTSSENISLKGYSIKDKSGKTYNFTNQVVKANGYLNLNANALGISINTSNEILYLYYDGGVVDSFNVDKILGYISTGRDEEGKKVYYKNITLGSKNSDITYSGFSSAVIFSKNGGYVNSGEEITLSTIDGSKIYYTLDGTFPTVKSKEYKDPIVISKNTVIKAIAYREGMIESDITSRTFIVGREHDVAFISISSDNNSFFGYNGLITNYHSNQEKSINFEFYESDGTLGTSFLGDVKLSGMDSREQPQKSMSIYLRKRYGINKVNYPFFLDTEYHTYSSLLLRNAGEDPKNVRIMDASISRILNGQMDIDAQAYRPVVVYINGAYYGLYNLREKLNGDYVESKFGIDKDNIDLIKYYTPTKGTVNNYNALVNYINSHNTANKDVYEYLKTQIDIEELINYWIAESFFGNTDLGNIRYWKAKDGKWRWMLYDMDWSLWNSYLDIGYPVKYSNIPAATYLYSSITIVRSLYRNSEFKDLYLKTLAYHLKNTFKPDRMTKIVDELAHEIEKEMPYHITRWGSVYPSLNSVTRWQNNLYAFKSSLITRYNRVISSLQSSFGLSYAEYTKYFGDLK